MDGILRSKIKLLSGEQAIQVVRELNRWLGKTKDVTWASIQDQISILVDRVLRG